MGLTPMGKAKGLFSPLGAKSNTAGAAERTFLLESNRFELQWIANSLWLT